MKHFTGFTDQDFDVFTIDGLDERMDVLKERIRPKLEFLGDHFAPTLSTLTGDEMFPHVAKHARRTKNPPDDTWVALASNKRGYKKLPHFQIGLWQTHVFVWFAIIYESPIKTVYAEKLEKELDNILKEIPPSFVWSMDHTKPEVMIQNSLTRDDFSNMIDRLKNVKKSEILCGINIDRDDPILNDGQKVLSKVEETFKTIMPLYQLSLNIEV